MKITQRALLDALLVVASMETKPLTYPALLNKAKALLDVIAKEVE